MKRKPELPAKKLEGERMYAMLIWLQDKSERMRVPFRALHYQVLQVGARRLGLKPPNYNRPEPLLSE